MIISPCQINPLLYCIVCEVLTSVTDLLVFFHATSQRIQTGPEVIRVTSMSSSTTVDLSRLYVLSVPARSCSLFIYICVYLLDEFVLRRNLSGVLTLLGRLIAVHRLA